MKNFIEVHVITHENAPTTKVLINVSSIFIVESLFNNAIIGIQMPSSNKSKHSASCVFFSPLFLPTFVASL